MSWGPKSEKTKTGTAVGRLQREMSVSIASEVLKNGNDVFFLRSARRNSTAKWGTRGPGSTRRSGFGGSGLGRASLPARLRLAEALFECGANGKEEAIVEQRKAVDALRAPGAGGALLVGALAQLARWVEHKGRDHDKDLGVSVRGGGSDHEDGLRSGAEWVVERRASRRNCCNPSRPPALTATNNQQTTTNDQHKNKCSSNSNNDNNKNTDTPRALHARTAKSITTVQAILIITLMPSRFRPLPLVGPRVPRGPKHVLSRAAQCGLHRTSMPGVACSARQGHSWHRFWRESAQSA